VAVGEVVVVFVVGAIRALQAADEEHSHAYRHQDG
jgi:hypothetical protein